MSVTEAKFGKPVRLLVDAKGFQDGRAVLFEIWKEIGQNKEKIDQVDGAVRRQEAIGQWEPKFKREQQLPLKDKMSQPQKEQYSFTATVGKDDADGKSVQGTPIEFTYPLAIYVEDVNGKPLNDVKFTVTFSNGTKEEDVLKNGLIIIEDAPAGKFTVELVSYDFVFQSPICGTSTSAEGIVENAVAFVGKFREFLTLKIRLFDASGRVIPNSSYRLIVGEEKFEGTTKDGWVEKKIQANEIPDQCFIEWEKDNNGAFKHSVEVNLKLESIEAEVKRLENLGYIRDPGLFGDSIFEDFKLKFYIREDVSSTDILNLHDKGFKEIQAGKRLLDGFGRRDLQK